MQFKKYLKDKSITDVILTGFADTENNVAEMCADLKIVHFEVGNYYVIFESVEQFSKLKISVDTKLKYNSVDDDDMVDSFVSIRNIILHADCDINRDGNKILSVHIYNKMPSEKSCIMCDAAKIILAGGQTIFLDPSHIFGIKIGGNEQEKCWIDNLINNKKIVTDIYKLD